MWELFYHMAFHAVIVFGFCYSFLFKLNLIIHIYLNTNINICGRNWECDFQWSGSSALLTPPLSLHCPHTTFLKTVHTVCCKHLTWPAWTFQAWPLTVPQQSVVSQLGQMAKTRQKLDFFQKLMPTTVTNFQHLSNDQKRKLSQFAETWLGKTCEITSS